MDGSTALSHFVAQERQDVASKGSKDDSDGSKNTDSGKEPATLPAAALSSSSPSSFSSSSTLSSSDQNNEEHANEIADSFDW